MCLGLTYATWNPVLKTNWPTNYLPTKAELASAEKSGVFIMLPEGNSTCSTCLLKNLLCTFVVKVAKAKSKGKLIAEWKGPSSEQVPIRTDREHTVDPYQLFHQCSRALSDIGKDLRTDACSTTLCGEERGQHPGANIERILLSCWFNITLLRPRHTIFSPNMKGASII